MQTDSIELGFLSIFALMTFFIFLITEKYSYKLSNGLLLDKDFNKPQAFHDRPISRSGGFACFISLLLFIYFYYVIYEKILYEYIYISSSLFFIVFSLFLLWLLKWEKRATPGREEVKLKKL